MCFLLGEYLFCIHEALGWIPCIERIRVVPMISFFLFLVNEQIRKMLVQCLGQWKPLAS